MGWESHIQRQQLPRQISRMPRHDEWCGPGPPRTHDAEGAWSPPPSRDGGVTSPPRAMGASDPEVASWASAVPRGWREPERSRSSRRGGGGGRGPGSRPRRPHTARIRATLGRRRSPRPAGWTVRPGAWAPGGQRPDHRGSSPLPPSPPRVGLVQEDGAQPPAALREAAHPGVGARGATGR